MYCNNCGAQVDNAARFCTGCGKTLNGTSQQNAGAAGQSGSIGYSTRIHDPAFARYVKNSNRWAAIFSMVLAAAAIIGFYIAGENSSEMENPQSLYIGFGIGGMFLLIALFQILGKKRSKTWDGAVVDKKIEKKREKHYSGSDDNDYYWEDYLLYTVIIRSQEGKIYKLSAKNDDTKFNYYQVGDLVRHHGGLNSYEKYDKTRDSIIFCNSCSTLNEITSDHCFRCKCPLLK